MAISAHIEATTRWLITAERSTKKTVCTVEEMPTEWVIGNKLLHYKPSNPPIQPEQTLTDVRLFEIGGQR